MASFVTAARIRCPNQADIASESPMVVSVDKDNNTVSLLAVNEETNELIDPNAQGEEGKPKTWRFNHVFGMNSSGGEVYTELAKPLLATVLEGCNANLSVVGQSGGGKTYTLAGGVLPALSKDLFASPDLVSVDVSYLEVHSEKLMDLLNPDQTPDLVIREQPGYGVYVSGLTKLRVNNEPELMKLIDDGEYPRQNSNSTTILTLFVRSHAQVAAENEDGGVSVSFDGSGGGGDVMGKFQLVEYCAYEPETENQLALEAFGEVVTELSKMPDASRRNHLDFKESNLTWLLKESLGGNCKTAFIGALSPTLTSYQQSLAVLRLLDFLIPCKGGPMPNVYPQYNFIKQINTELQSMRGLLEAELEIEDEDEMISRRWIEGKAACGHEVATEYIQKEKFLLELGASEEEKQQADKEKKNKRVQSMRKFKAEDADQPKVDMDEVAGDAPIIEEEDTPSEDGDAGATAADAAPLQTENTAEETQEAATPEKQQVQQQEESTPSNALIAAATNNSQQQVVRAVTPGGTPTKQLTAMSEKEFVENSPRAKIHTYAESDRDFGVTSPTTLKNQVRRPKICLDHLGVDVPSEEQLMEIFKVFDPNGDGRISLVEFRSIFKDAFENFGAPMEDRDVDRLFAKFDTGVGRYGKAHDGFLSYQEFCILVLNRLRQ